MVLNNVTKFHKILIKTIPLREGASFKTVNFHKQRAITAESMVRYGPLLNLEEDITVLNNVATFHKFLIKNIPLRERTSFHKLKDLKVLRRSPDHLNNVKIVQGQLQLIMNKLCFTIYGGCSHFGQVT